MTRSKSCASKFEKARLECNNKQTCEDRKIKDYFKKVCDSQNDIACEIIIELVDMDFWNDKDQEYRLKMIDVYNEQIKDLTKIMPTFKIQYILMKSLLIYILLKYQLLRIAKEE